MREMSRQRLSSQSTRRRNQSGTPRATDDGAVDQEQDHRANHAADEARALSGFIPSDSLTEVGGDERADNPQNGGQNEALRLRPVAGHDELGNHSNDKPNDDRP